MAGALKVNVRPDAVRLQPGGSPATLTVDVYNGTGIVDEFWVGAPGEVEWAQVTPTVVRLFPETSESAEISVSIPAGVMVPAGDRTLRLHTRSASKLDMVDVREVRVSVDAVTAEQTMSLEPQTLRGSATSQSLITIRNGSNFPLSVRLKGNDPEGALSFRFDPAELQIPAGGEGGAWVTLSGKAPLGGSERVRPFTVEAEGGPQSITATGTFYQSPLVTSTRVWLIRLLLALSGAGLLMASAFLSWGQGVGDGSPRDGLGWDFAGYTRQTHPFGTYVQEGSGLDAALGTPFTSVGSVAVLVGLVILLGALVSSGRMSKIAGLAAIAGVPVFYLLPLISGRAIALGDLFVDGLGLFVAAIGGIIGLLSGFIATR